MHRNDVAKLLTTIESPGTLDLTPRTVTAFQHIIALLGEDVDLELWGDRNGFSAIFPGESVTIKLSLDRYGRDHAETTACADLLMAAVAAKGWRCDTEKLAELAPDDDEAVVEDAG